MLKAFPIAPGIFSKYRKFSNTFQIMSSSFSSTNLPQGVTLIKPVDSSIQSEILTPECLQFLAKLHSNFEPRRQELLQKRVERQHELDNGILPDFLPSTASIRSGNWTIDPVPAPLQKRWVEITGPVDRKMVINALNSGANCYMADFEDSNTPTWDNQLSGQLNLKDAIRRRIDFKVGDKEYKLNTNVATLLVRPRGWHMDEKHLLINGQRCSGGLFDFGIYFYHNARKLLETGLGPYFYLPKMESHLEARVWNDVFSFSESEIGIPVGSIKATVLIETILAAFEMDEILYELRQHSAGLNAGRWDYIFSCIKKFRNSKELCFPDRSFLTMKSPFMRAYAQLLVKTCHRRNAPAIGGMSALIPIKDDPDANEKALQGVREDKIREVNDGFDGTWVAHPALCKVAHEEFSKVLGNNSNQIHKQSDITITSKDLLNFMPEPPIITEAGIRTNISIALQYLANWLLGKGCVPISNLMEDAATAEISRALLWMWIHSPKGVLNDGRKVTEDLVNQIVKEELVKLKKANPKIQNFDDAAEKFTKVAVDKKFEEFLTLPLYETF